MPETEHRRPNPDQTLKKVEAEECPKSRGRLKIFLGYTSGVGKSFRMLDEGRRRKERGQDVVVAATQPVAPPEVEEILKFFEVIPPRPDLGPPAIDVPAILARKPKICLIDGLAYQNPPGSKNPQRWQDVAELLAAGITVSTSINLQYVKERQEQVEAIRGRAVHDSVPEAFIRTADEIEIVDVPAEYCLQRARETGPDFERLEQQLSELREIALLLAADVVDHQLEEYLHGRGIEHLYGTQERILLCLTPRSNASLMIQRGRRQADRFHGELHAVYVKQGDLPETVQRVLDSNLEAARDAEAQVEILHGDDPVDVILRFAVKNGITQIFTGHSEGAGWTKRWKPNFVERLIMESEGIDVRIFPQTGPRDA